MPDCPTCKNRGGCRTCSGTGSHGGKRCLICRGNGLCAVCHRPLDPTAPPEPGREATPPATINDWHVVAAPSIPTPSNSTLTASTSPTYTPTFKRWSSAKVAFRALLAVFVLASFYVFALAIIALLLWVAWFQVQMFNDPRGGIGIGWLLIVCPLAALAIAVAIWPRFHSWSDPGRGVTEQRAPELWAMLREVSRASRQPMVRRLYLFDEVNAFVANRGPFMGRAIGLGLPLFDLLTVSELRAVVAHEYGHDASRAGGLSTFVYRTVVTFMGASEAAGIVPGLNVLFELWADLYLRIAMPISRQQELRSDEMACYVAGVDATIAGLTKITTKNPYGEIADPMPGWEQDLT